MIGMHGASAPITLVKRTSRITTLLALAPSVDAIFPNGRARSASRSST